MKTLSIKNAQKTRAINVPFLKKILRHLLQSCLQQQNYELGFRLVNAQEMALVNETFLQHNGSTDVITFAYAEPSSEILRGEVFISVDDAVTHARQFKTTWQAELVRYCVHSILHLRGFDDLQPADRKKMKREEQRLLAELATAFPLNQVQLRTKKS